MKKTLKVVFIALVASLAIIAISINLVSLAVGNGSLGSSMQQKNFLNDIKQREVAYELYKQSCSSPTLSIDEFKNGMTKQQADECNQNPNRSGITFIGGNGNEMFLLSHNQWDVRSLYATYYLLQRGFDGEEKYSLRMDCSPPGFEPRTKMTVGIHYGKKDGREISFINSLDDPTPNMQQQYLAGATRYSPEGSDKFNNMSAISPHAFGQAVDIYSYGCTSVYVRLDSQEEAARWACGYSRSSPYTIAQHSYFYPIKNIKNEISFIDSNPSFNSTPDNSNKPDAQKRYLLDPTPALTGCNTSTVAVTVSNACDPPNSPVITYSNGGCVALNQPNNPGSPSYYKSNYFYDSPQLGYYSREKSRIQPFQFLKAVRLDNPFDTCKCVSTSVPTTVPDNDRSAYQNKRGPISFVDPAMPLTIPPSLKRGYNDDQLKDYLQRQAEASRKIVLEASMLFSIRQNNNDYPEAEKLFEHLVGVNRLPKKQYRMNQIASPTIGNYPVSDSYNFFAHLLYQNKALPNNYYAELIKERNPGLGYNSTDKDRIHLGF